MSGAAPFQRIVIVDWSAAAQPRRGADSIWIANATARSLGTENIATRLEAIARLEELLGQALAAGERVLVGFDFAFGLPMGAIPRLTGGGDALDYWRWLAERVIEGPRNACNYRDVAAAANDILGPGAPFWGDGRQRATRGLPRKRPPLPRDIPPGRVAETVARLGRSRPKSPWQLAGAGAVGAQSLTGIPLLQRLRGRLGGAARVWPFEPADHAPVVLAEVYPSLLSPEVAAARLARPWSVTDEVQVRILAERLAALSAESWQQLLAPAVRPEILREEGWILGAGLAHLLTGPAPEPALPPRLRNDCFALPQGVDWLPVDTALDRLRGSLTPIVGTEELPLLRAGGRILARDVLAATANPPHANAAVDGYGFAAASTGAGVQRLPLVAGRAAAGVPHAGRVPPGAAIRILTGAILPRGVDTVVLQEDVAIADGHVVLDGPVRPGSNTRAVGEDVAAGALALPAGLRLRAQDLALAAALGSGLVTAHRPLRVGVLSTGDEIVAAGAGPLAPGLVHDANRPMLLRLAACWGHLPIDLGHCRDRRALLARRLTAAAARADVIIASGGASSGDEDHLPRLLGEEGQLSSWRIAMKPGRPLALGLWRGVPVFGLPGNPVAAFVCALVFARPALSLMAGGGWLTPEPRLVPAAFAKSKKAGRREYLRARLNGDGAAEVFASEGSGRISGLSWARGLVELDEAAAEIGPGDPVRYTPFSAFGID